MRPGMGSRLGLCRMLVSTATHDGSAGFMGWNHSRADRTPQER